MNARAHIEMELPDTAAGRLLWGAFLVEPVDLKVKARKAYLTVELPADMAFRTGTRYVLVNELDAKDALLCDAMAEPGPDAVVLAADDWTGTQVFELAFGGLEVLVGRGVKFTLYQRWPDAKHPYKLHWWGLERRKDAIGRWWETYLPHFMVMNDFGDLVEVPEC